MSAPHMNAAGVTEQALLLLSHSAEHKRPSTWQTVTHFRPLPPPIALQAVLRAALDSSGNKSGLAGLSMHGTATPLGDPIGGCRLMRCLLLCVCAISLVGAIR